MKKIPDNDFMNILKKFDMISETGKAPGLVFVEDNTNTWDDSERISLEYAMKYGADAVYFRRFDDKRPPVPQIFIYDYTVNEKNETEIADLYKKLWNSGQVPLFFVFLKTEVKIFSCLKKPEFDTETGKISVTVFEKIRLASKIKREIDRRKLKNFSAKFFDNGSFWRNPEYKDRFKQKESAYMKLLSELKETRKKIIKSKILKEDIAQKLLVMSILVKYLEERIDENNDTVFPPGFFKSFSRGTDTFTGVLRKKGGCLKLFDHLSSSDCLNGDIFKWNDKKERKILQNSDLETFADFFEGKTDKGQYTFWRLYSFNDLPIELISNIYEEFLESRKGIVYTPPYLVNFLIDEMMPLSDFDKTDFKVIDPACGSGVFLVAAFRRMLHWWRIRNGWKKPDATDLNELKQIIKNNIFGVDKHEEAVRLAFFSLSLALLDELSSKVIWENLKFDNLLESNLISKDFFELINKKHFRSEFDLVIGNPPFIRTLTPEAEKIEKRKIKEKSRPKLPGRQIALLFLEQAMNLCKPGSWLCLILPSGSFLYNNTSKKFRKYFLKTYQVAQIIDFTCLSQILFESVNVATAAVFAKKQDPSGEDILHVTVRRTKPVKEKLYFELDHYDFHKVSHNEAMENRLIWKANLLGGGRLHHLIKRFGTMRCFGDYLKDRENKHGWKVGEGFTVGGNGKERDELIQLEANKKCLSQIEKERLTELKKKYKKAAFLTGKKTLSTDAFTEKGINEFQLDILKEMYFTRNRKKNQNIFKGPHVLIKEAIAKKSIPIEFRNDDLSFTHEILGIHAPRNQIDELMEIERRIKNSRDYLFYPAALSGLYMIGRVTALLKKDIESLPFPEDEKELELSIIERILVDDVLDYMLDFRRNGEKSIAEKPVNNKQLDQFADVYCRVLNSVYHNFKPHRPIKTDSFICFPFYYKDKPEILKRRKDDLESDLHKLIRNNVSTNARIVRILRLYDDNTIFLIKPEQTRFWLRSMAIRDADETFNDLVAQGY
ncbi:N-6 DNA methylase [Desulfobacterales bacterium HSG16]|nr:N-6 DNA methylase [Desulfobacterales bacterium HSG16]